MIVGFNPVQNNRFQAKNNKNATFTAKPVDEATKLMESVIDMLWGKNKVNIDPATLLKATDKALEKPDKLQNLRLGLNHALKEGRISRQVIEEAQKLAKNRH